MDGQLRDSEAVTGLHNPSRLPFMIGAAPSRYGSPRVGPTGFFNGQIKAVRVSQKILYTASFDPPDELDHQGRSTVLQFCFDTGSGNRVKSGRVVGQIHDAEWVKVDAKAAAAQPPAARPPAATIRLPIPGLPATPYPTRPSSTGPSFDHLPRRPLPPPDGATGTASP